MDSNNEAPRIEPSSSRTTWTPKAQSSCQMLLALHYLTAAFYVGNGWVAGGCWDDEITSDEIDHSRKLLAFSTSKLCAGNAQSNSLHLFFTGHISAGLGPEKQKPEIGLINLGQNLGVLNPFTIGYHWRHRLCDWREFSNFKTQQVKQTKGPPLLEERVTYVPEGLGEQGHCLSRIAAECIRIQDKTQPDGLTSYECSCMMRANHNFVYQQLILSSLVEFMSCQRCVSVQSRSTFHMTPTAPSATAAQPAGIRSGTCWNLGMAKMALAKSGEFTHFTQNGNLAIFSHKKTMAKSFLSAIFAPFSHYKLYVSLRPLLSGN